MATVAKFPSAALSDFGGDLPGFPEATLSGAHNNSTTTITLTATVPTAWPNIGWVTIDSEIIKYAAKSGATLTGCTRGDQSAYGGSAAASHLDQAKVGFYLTPQVVNQIIAEIIAMQTSVSNPNLVLNSDFGRRTVFGLAMPEVFADTSGATAVDGSLGSVASNVLTAGTNGTWSVKWCGTNAAFYRDGRWSALVKQNGTGTTNVGRIGIGKADGTAWLTGNGVYATYYRTGVSTVTLELIKVIAGVVTVVASQAGVTWTDARVGWAEIEAQGTTYIARFYDQGSGTPGLKSAATRLDNGTITGTVGDAGVTSGQPMAVNGSGVGAATVWGGIATGNGGVYVETWLPESFDWTPATVFGGTLGGQAVGYDESANAGPGLGTSANGKQWAIRTYIPATSRTITLQQFTTDGASPAGASVAFSGYLKTSGKGGSGDLVRWNYKGATGGAATGSASITLADAAETVWTRKSGTVASDAAATQARIQVLVNPTSTATGTSWVSCVQLEQGSAATSWRNAPEDGAPEALQTLRPAGTDLTTTSASFVEPDSRDLAANFFAPWDCTLSIQVDAQIIHGTAGQNVDFTVTVDGVAVNPMWRATAYVANYAIPVKFAVLARVAAGKHRIAVQWRTSAATATLQSASFNTYLNVTAFRGK